MLWLFKVSRKGQVGARGQAAALTGEWGGELDNNWLSAEGIISTGLAAIIILVAVQHRHLVRPAEGQARGGLTWARGTALANLPVAAGKVPGLSWDSTQIHQPRTTFARVVRPNAAPALWLPVLAPHLEERLMGFLYPHHPLHTPASASDLRRRSLISRHLGFT